MDQNGSKTKEKMKYFIFLILLICINTDPKNASLSHQLKGVSKFTSTLQETRQWSSETREYCFLKKELTYVLQYEFSPIPIPSFQLRNGLFDVYITVDIDPAYPIQFQKLAIAWAKFSNLNPNENICVEGAYLPPATPKDAAYVMIEQIKSKNLQLAIKDYILELE